MKDTPMVVTMKDYGKIYIKLNELLEEQELTRNALARAVNTRFEVVDKWCGGKMEKIDADILARICYVLDCNVGDILDYRK